MSIFHWNEARTLSFRTIDTSGSDYHADPICRASLSDLEADEDFWAVVFADLYHLDVNND